MTDTNKYCLQLGPLKVRFNKNRSECVRKKDIIFHYHDDISLRLSNNFSFEWDVFTSLPYLLDTALLEWYSFWSLQNSDGSLSLSRDFHLFKSVYIRWGGSSRDVIDKVLACGLKVNEFEFQSRNWSHIRTNTFGKGMNPQLWVKLYHWCFPRRMALAFNNPQRLICH